MEGEAAEEAMWESSTEPPNSRQEPLSRLQPPGLTCSSVHGHGETESPRPGVCEREGGGPERLMAQVKLEDGGMLLLDNFGRTDDGKLKCGYCNYTSRGAARLVEHIRIHTGEKPHRCQLCPFASAYERHLESHMRSHTGEKPYKCELCPFRCSDRSNLSHHRRRRHKELLTVGANGKTLSDQHKKPGSISFRLQLPVNRSSPSTMEDLDLDYTDGLADDVSPPLHPEAYEGLIKVPHSAVMRDARLFLLDSHLDQLAGQLDVMPSQVTHLSASGVSDPQTLDATSESAPSSAAVPTPDPLVSAFRLSTPTSGSRSGRGKLVATDSVSPGDGLQTLYLCPHCQTYFADNILYTVHMGCHGYEKPFQCNTCGSLCQDKYDFACHLAQGHHQKRIEN